MAVAGKVGGHCNRVRPGQPEKRRNALVGATEQRDTLFMGPDDRVGNGACDGGPGDATSTAKDSAAIGSTPSKASAAAGALTTDGMYGNPAAAAKYWQRQSLTDDCGLVSVADVVGEITGQEPTEQQIIALAENTPSESRPGPIYVPPADPSHPNGVEMADEGVLLDHYGIKSVLTDNRSPDQTGGAALARYLVDNRKVIAWVNSATLWNSSDQRTRPDHFVVVTGIDTNREIVHLSDSAVDHPDEQVSTATFTEASQIGRDSILVTQAAEHPNNGSSGGPRLPIAARYSAGRRNPRTLTPN
jgi:hypothetical protein